MSSSSQTKPMSGRRRSYWDKGTSRWGDVAVGGTFVALFAVVSRLAGAGAVPGAALQRVLLHTLTLLRAARAKGPPGTGCSHKERKHQLCNYAGAGWNCTLLQNTTAAEAKPWFCFQPVHPHSTAAPVHVWVGKRRVYMIPVLGHSFHVKQYVVNARTRNISKQTQLIFQMKKKLGCTPRQKLLL